MASASSFLSEDQFLCSVCLDVFTEPVSIPCGHNFCKACISRHWKGKQQCQCPLCNRKFNKGLKLHINTAFREIVENFKKLSQETSCTTNNFQVLCDFCLGKKVKASKTCLVCLASYCEQHLEPHETVGPLKRHTLTEPVQNLEDKICKKHNRILELFCRNDLSSVCILCTDHSGHDTVSLDKEYEEKKVQLEQKKVEVQEMIQERQKKAQEIKEMVQNRNKDKDEAVMNTVQIFTTLVVSIQKHMAQLVSVIEQKQKAAERQAEVLVKELEKENKELQRRIPMLENMSHSEDQLQFIKNFLSFSSSSPCTKNWSDVSINGNCSEDMKRAMVQMEEMLANETAKANEKFRLCCAKIVEEEPGMLKKTEHADMDLETLPEGMKLDAFRQQYAVDMTFDPCTANDLLLFSEDLKQVQTSHIWWFANKGPHKFDRYAYVLGKKGFSEGRYYYEVQASQKTGWDLGVVRESMRGKKTFTPNPRDGVWIIRLRNNTKLKALNNVPVVLPLVKKPERVGVFVDYEEGLVSFYDVDASSLIYSFTGCNFKEKIYPFFSPGPSEEGLNGAPLVLSPAKTPGVWAQYSELLSMIITVIALILIWFN
ncbi:E3 ubiquitin-protein ligase TRIM21-like [Anabas testudineus]|uniref:E3 ubiquitin-protein ligase TRIM39-like n=1 Tax=Anabas testudineus TaxID=64144 RepID=A0A3Q1JIJ3_ANATE|nr:E3 ubiquitin-protein ligase TRIM21-like [Anabas testudineus]